VELCTAFSGFPYDRHPSVLLLWWLPPTSASKLLGPGMYSFMLSLCKWPEFSAGTAALATGTLLAVYVARKFGPRPADDLVATAY